MPDRNAGDGEDERVAASAPTNQFGAVHYSFGGQALAKNQPQRSTPPEIVAFANGWLTELPPGSALPQTFKQHQVNLQLTYARIFFSFYDPFLEPVAISQRLLPFPRVHVQNCG